APRRRVDAGRGEEDDVVGPPHAGDEMLAAVDYVVAAGLHGAGLDAHGVGPGVGLGEGKGLLALAGDGRDQIALALRALADVEDLRRPADPAHEAPGGLPELAVHQGHGEEIKAAAADLGRHVGGIEAELPGALVDLLAKLGRHRAQPLDLALVRKDFLGHELAHGVDEEALLLRRREVPGHAQRPPNTGSRRAMAAAIASLASSLAPQIAAARASAASCSGSVRRFASSMSCFACISATVGPAARRRAQ